MAVATETRISNPTTGLRDGVHESQAVFRAVLEALSRPGRPRVAATAAEPPQPLTRVSAAVALTLVDQDVTLWLSPSLDCPEVRDYLVFHTGARVVAQPHGANFVVCSGPGEIPPLDTLAQGTPDYPDRSATVIVSVADTPTHTDPRATLSGPGIEHPFGLGLPGFDRALWRQLQHNHRAYPLGVDLVVCIGQSVIGLPRSTAIEVA